MLEASALYFQYGLELGPCIMCVYQRVALFGVLFAGFLGVVSPHHPATVFSGLFLWLYSAYQGLVLALEHVEIQENPSPYYTCDVFPNFPQWLPLHEWLPSVFFPTGDCGEIAWSLFDISMPQWMIIVFGCYLSVAVIVGALRLHLYYKTYKEKI
jgi:disulfide bond formation protein DsbB